MLPALSERQWLDVGAGGGAGGNGLAVVPAPGLTTGLAGFKGLLVQAHMNVRRIATQT